MGWACELDVKYMGSSAGKGQLGKLKTRWQDKLKSDIEI
jgi:hypothetical protein